MATVIRGDRSRSPHADTAPQPTEFRLSDMGAHGDRYVNEVRQRAAQVVADAKAEAATIRADAEKQGLAAAEQKIAEQVKTQLNKELSTLRPALQSAVAELRTARGDWLEHWRVAASGLAVAIAERIVRRELQSDPTIREEWLAEALCYAAGASDITVRLAPTDFENLRDYGTELAESTAGLAETQFVSDEAIEPGGCRVETRHGTIDQQLSTQLERLEEELLG